MFCHVDTVLLRVGVCAGKHCALCPSAQSINPMLLFCYCICVFMTLSLFSACKTSLLNFGILNLHKTSMNSSGLYKGRKHCRLRSSGRPINPPCQLENTFLLTNEPHSHLYSRLSRPCSPSSFLQVETK